jgi:hypothetical protein
VIVVTSLPYGTDRPERSRTLSPTVTRQRGEGIMSTAKPLTEPAIASQDSAADDSERVPTHGSAEMIGPEALQAIGELLQAASQYGLGVAFEPDGEGWKVSYIPGEPVWEEYELPSGELSNAYDLHIAAAAALKPLVELGEQAAYYFAEQDQKRA